MTPRHTLPTMTKLNISAITLPTENQTVKHNLQSPSPIETDQKDKGCYDFLQEVQLDLNSPERKLEKGFSSTEDLPTFVE